MIPADEDPSSVEATPSEILTELLEEVSDGLGLEAQLHVGETASVITGSLEGDDLGLFIGRRGQTIDAVQHLAQRIVFRGGPADVRVVIDAGGYRARRAAALRSEADAAADAALRTGVAVELEPMPPSERRVVHEHLRERGDVLTHSEGDEPDRRLVVEPPSA